MEEVSIIGVDLAKNVFQLHGAAAEGSVVFRKKLSRPRDRVPRRMLTAFRQLRTPLRPKRLICWPRQATLPSSSRPLGEYWLQ